MSVLLKAEMDILPTVKFNRIDTDRGRFYESKEGIKYPSVTTILGATKPFGSRIALQKWKERVGKDEAERISEVASERGSITHEQVEAFFREEDKDCPDWVMGYWESIEPFLSEITKVRLIEGTVFHPVLRYAGTADLVAEYKDHLCIFDWKTSDKPKKNKGNLYDYPFQLAAYCGAINRQYQDHGIELNRGVIVVGVPGEEAEVFEFTPNEIMKYWEKWKVRVDQYYGKGKGRR